MSSASSLDGLILRLRQGDDAAAAKLFHRFASRLVALAHTRLDKRIRQVVGAEDVVQSVFKSFFRRAADDQLELKDWESLWGLLVVITIRKCGKRARHFFGPRRDLRKEVSAALPTDQSDTDWEFMARGPEPADALVLVDLLEQIKAELSEREQRILELRLEGYTVPEISEQVGRTEYTVSGALRRIRRHLRKIRDAEMEAPAVSEPPKS
jgi:RNA polymerase sigma factor (sigma-70 family)